MYHYNSVFCNILVALILCHISNTIAQEIITQRGHQTPPNIQELAREVNLDADDGNITFTINEQRFIIRMVADDGWLEISEAPPEIDIGDLD